MEPTGVQAGTGWYVYGVVAPSNRLPDLTSGGTVDPANDVELLVEGPLAALVSRVSLAEFDEPSLSERLRDPIWLEAKIRGHEQVLERVLAETSVVPFRFCTVYRGEQDLRRFLSERSSELATALRRVEGRVELGVKAFVNRRRFTEGLAEREDGLDPAEGATEPGGGRAYLERRLAEQRVADELDRFAAEVVDRSHAQLLSEAEEGTLLRLQSKEVSGRSDDMLMNGAYLVPARSPGLARAVSRLAQEYAELGVTFEVTGPWPPYNFVPREVDR